MKFLTGKHMPRRTFLRGMGATVALPFLDAMVPAVGRSKARRRGRPTRLVCIEVVHGVAGCNDVGREQVPLGAGDDRPRLPLMPDSALSRSSLAQVPDDRQQHRRAHGRSVRAAGDRRRPLPVERGVPHAVAPEADAGLRRLRRHVARPDVRASSSARTRRSRRCSSASRTSIRPAAAPTTTPAPTPTRSAGRARTSRCR